MRHDIVTLKRHDIVAIILGGTAHNQHTNNYFEAAIIAYPTLKAGPYGDLLDYLEVQEAGE